jgi:AraC-type DNA-binding domain-containing proteins
MEKKQANYYYGKMPDENFFVDVIKREIMGRGPVLYSHWHEHIQFFYVVEGDGFMECNSQRFNIHPKDFIVVNSNELHYTESLSDHFSCYIIRVDFSFLDSRRIDSCQNKYLTPIADNVITFHNLIRGEEQIMICIENIIDEYFSKRLGYELAIKSDLYRLLVLLLRNYADHSISKKEAEVRSKNLTKMRQVFQYIDENLSKKMTIHELAAITYLSDYHFCKIFKQVSGRSAIDYINMLRTEKAIQLLKEGNFNITEVALACGYSDSNYFSRTFKKYRGISPKAFL